MASGEAGGAPASQKTVIIGAGIFSTVGTAAAGGGDHIGAGPALVLSFVFVAIACGFAPRYGDIDPYHMALCGIDEALRNIVCVGWNYLEHFAEGAKMRDASQKLPEHPLFFTKATGALNGPFDPIPYDPSVSSEIDWEVELAVVIGKSGRNISEGEAADHVFGYTVLNDVSARDLQKTAHGGQWFKGKSLDGHAPMGPWLIPAADIEPDNLRLILRVNGAVKQDGNTKDMYFKIPRIIAELSRGLTLEPGDVIATGTPSGVGMGLTPPEWLKPGDVMETEIAGIGAMRNRIHAV